MSLILTFHYCHCMTFELSLMRLEHGNMQRAWMIILMDHCYSRRTIAIARRHEEFTFPTTPVVQMATITRASAQLYNARLEVNITQRSTKKLKKEKRRRVEIVNVGFEIKKEEGKLSTEYLNEAELIPMNTSVVLQRIPKGLCAPIIVPRKATNIIDNKEKDNQSSRTSPPTAEEIDWHDFGADLCTDPDLLEVQATNTTQNVAPISRAEEDKRINALINTWQIQDGPVPREYLRRRCKYMFAQAPPLGYICRRCNVSGHFIQDYPTNGDPNYNIKKLKPPTDIPKSMLMATSDGSYALTGGAVATLKPNETTFEREMEGILHSTRSLIDNML